MIRSRMSQTDAATVATDAFVFGYPLVLADLTRAWMTAVAAPDPLGMRAPLNRFVHARGFPRANADGAPGSHADTLRSSAWLDVGGAPVLLTVPETHGRFYALTLVDLWTNVFAAVGARTTGTESGAYAIGGPRWVGGPLPAGAHPVAAPTRFIRIAGLTQVEGNAGVAAAYALQDEYRLLPLGSADRNHRPAPIVAGERPALVAAPPAERAPPVGGERLAGGTPPLRRLERMDALTFFATLNRLMRDNPPRLEDRPIVERMRKLDLLLEDEDDWRRLDRDVRHAVERGAETGLERVVAAAGSPPGDPVGGWRLRFRRGDFGTDYLGRAGAACAELDAGQAADEVPALVGHDSHGRPLSGHHRYVLRFPPGGAPPVHGLWTLTTYDACQALVDNPADRYSIGDWNGLTLDADGSLPIQIQHTRPAAGLRPNWLPAPPGPFNILLRLIWPQQDVLDRRWTPPDVTRVR
jgi:hypothetical protein